MIKTATMFTYELDDAEQAMAELKDPLRKQTALRKNTVGILICDPEFIKTGVVKTICARLPFPVVGATSMAQAVNGETGRLILTLMVLTSDDVFFAVGTSKAASKEDVSTGAGASYAAAAGGLGVKPEMIVLFTPFNMEIPGNIYLDVFASLCPNTPVFGTLAVDDLPKFADCLTIYNGYSSKENISFILIGGNVAPRFLIAAVSEERLLPYGGKITKSRGNVLMEINGERALEYFERIGLVKNGQFAFGLRFLPLVIDRKRRKYRGEAPIINELSHFDQNGFAVCRIDLKQQTAFEIGIFDSEYILDSSKKMIEKLNAEQDIQALIMFSCIGRRLSLHEEPLRELHLVSAVIDKNTIYMIAYSGGEICPVAQTAHTVENRFHNYALTACIL